jgi:hypothetical protein
MDIQFFVEYISNIHRVKTNHIDSQMAKIVFLIAIPGTGSGTILSSLI